MAQGVPVEFDPATTLLVDCTANGLAPRAPIPIWQENVITLQSVTQCQQVYSASVIASLECNSESDDEKNSLCMAVPHPVNGADFIKTFMISLRNDTLWRQNAQLHQFNESNRLCIASHDSAWTKCKMLWWMIPYLLPRLKHIEDNLAKIYKHESGEDAGFVIFGIDKPTADALWYKGHAMQVVQWVIPIIFACGVYCLC